eukprot:935355-Prymnesium_polylepis.1
MISCSGPRSHAAATAQPALSGPDPQPQRHRGPPLRRKTGCPTCPTTRGKQAAPTSCTSPPQLNSVACCVVACGLHQPTSPRAGFEKSRVAAKRAAPRGLFVRMALTK